MVTIEALSSGSSKIGVVGLGYVGLPLAVHLARHFKVVGYDLKSARINELQKGIDRTLEVEKHALDAVPIEFTDQPEPLAACGLIIVAVPTPIDAHRIPDLEPVRLSTLAVGRVMQPGTCVTFESTVYPGVTEEVCVPILSEASNLAFGRDFTVGYSPERINPGDKTHTIDRIIKIVSGSDAATLELLAAVYGRIVTAGIHRAATIRVAEAAKVIENTQRDLNIALMNELAMIFHKMGINTLDVLAAARTKWNFLPFQPGLVGGHCIGVDPYYLTFKAESLGYHPEMILAGRRINDQMGKYVAERTVKMLMAADKKVNRAEVAVLGLTFKEDVPDLRNTKVVDIIRELEDYGIHVKVYDPLADPDEALHYYGLKLVPEEELGGLDAVVVAVMHSAFKDKGLAGISRLCRPPAPIVIDVQAVFDPVEAAALGIRYWRL